MQSHFEPAEVDFQLASKLAPGKNLSYAGLGVSYMQVANLPEAVRTLRSTRLARVQEARRPQKQWCSAGWVSKTYGKAMGEGTSHLVYKCIQHS
jgi:hypothetical protein